MSMNLSASMVQGILSCPNGRMYMIVHDPGRLPTTASLNPLRSLVSLRTTTDFEFLLLPMHTDTVGKIERAMYSR